MSNTLSIGSLSSLRLLFLLDTLLVRSFQFYASSFSLFYFSFISFSTYKFGAFFVNISPPENDVFKMHFEIVFYSFGVLGTVCKCGTFA